MSWISRHKKAENRDAEGAGSRFTSRLRKLLHRSAPNTQTQVVPAQNPNDERSQSGSDTHRLEEPPTQVVSAEGSKNKQPHTSTGTPRLGHSPTQDVPNQHSDDEDSNLSTDELWLEAFESLNEEQEENVKVWIDGYDSSKQGNTRRDRKISALEIQEHMKKAMEEENKKRQSTTSRRVTNAVSVLNKFVIVGDIAVQYDPVHAALPWAAVRFLLVGLTSHVHIREHLLEGIAEAVTALANCDQFWHLYTDPKRPLPPDVALANLKKSVVNLYRAVQLFLGFAAHCTGNLLSGQFKLKDAQDHVKELSSGCQTLFQASNTCNQHYMSSLLEEIQEESLLRTLDWISPVSHGVQHNSIVDRRTPGTGEWILQKDAFCDWERADSAIFWLWGYAGAGKTFLTSKVIDQMQGLSRDSSEGFAYFYCNRNDTQRRDMLDILRSYVRQLSAPSGDRSHIQTKLQIIRKEAKMKGSHFSIKDCEDQLLTSTNLFTRTTIILDALDECELQTRVALIQWIKKLLDSSSKTLRIFISSRPDGDIREQLSAYSNIEIEARDNSHDVEKFVNQEITKHWRWSNMSLSLRDEIIKTLQEGSDGMFQWVNLQIQQLLELTVEKSIQERLGKLPHSLKTTYDEIYNQAGNDDREKATVMRACMWVMCAKKPFTTKILIGALDPKINDGETGSVDEHTLQHLCNNLLALDSQTKKWRFTHLSVREYFEDNHWGLYEAHANAAMACLNFLWFPLPEAERDGKDYSWGYNFSSHADRTWNYYVRELEVQPPRNEQDIGSRVHALLKRFLGAPAESSAAYRAWYQYGKTMIWYPGSPEEECLEPNCLGILPVCYFGFNRVLEDWWNRFTIQPSLTNANGDSLLTLAAAGGHELTCTILLARGVNVDIVSTHESGFGTALRAAIEHNRTEIATLLLEHGVDPNLLLPESRLGSALAAAALLGRNEIIELLIGHGAEVDLLVPGEFGSALTAAAYAGEHETVELLIKYGAQVDLLVPGELGSALTAAAYAGEHETVELLIEHGAQVDLLVPGKFGSALVAAASSGTAELFISHGAEVDLLVSGDFGSALAAAAFYGREDQLDLLIQSGADVNKVLSAACFGTALAAAAFMGNQSCLKKLLVANADLDLYAPMGDQPEKRTALQEARSDSLERRRHLPEPGEESWDYDWPPWEKDRESWWAAKEGAAELLLAHGAFDHDAVGREKRGNAKDAA